MAKQKGLRPPASSFFTFLQGDGMPKKHLCKPIAPHGCPQKNRHQTVA
ncbi:MAG: hypothetical protein PUF09_05600 [Bacteroidales bacterium]|nr:hypothetical protein [Bacteroidales bacterium]